MHALPTMPQERSTPSSCVTSTTPRSRWPRPLSRGQVSGNLQIACRWPCALSLSAADDSLVCHSRVTPWLLYSVDPLDTQRFSGSGCFQVSQPKSGQPAEVVGGLGARGVQTNYGRRNSRLPPLSPRRNGCSFTSIDRLRWRTDRLPHLIRRSRFHIQFKRLEISCCSLVISRA
jgi:hypothetical protein